MPLVRIDAVKGRSRSEIRGILDATHKAMITALKDVGPERIQIYQEHPVGNLIVEGLEPSVGSADRILLVTLIGRPQSQEVKQDFYRNLCQELRSRCSVEPRHVIVTVLTNSDADWSLGNGGQPFIMDFV